MGQVGRHLEDYETRLFFLHNEGGSLPNLIHKLGGVDICFGCTLAPFDRVYSLCFVCHFVCYFVSLMAASQLIGRRRFGCLQAFGPKACLRIKTAEKSLILVGL